MSSQTKTLHVNEPHPPSGGAGAPRFRQVMAEYIWRGGNGPVDLRSKTRVLTIEVDENDKPKQAVDLPLWNYDGSSTNQASVENSEVLLNPCSVFTDPFRGSPHVLVLCDTFDAETQNPLSGNTRVNAFNVFKEHADKKGAFAFEQEYVLSSTGSSEPLEVTLKKGTHYCGAQVHPKCRMIMENHLKACLVAGVSMSGCNVEVLPSQLEYQVGPAEGLAACDQLWVSRYILMRLCEASDLRVSFEPKPLSDPHHGASGCHVNFSTEEMREGTDGTTGLEHVLAAIPKLEQDHDQYLQHCGEGTHLRLTGTHETSSFDTFTHGVGDRSASVRVPKLTELNKKGYLEDRRPSSNVDPYVVASMLLECVAN